MVNQDFTQMNKLGMPIEAVSPIGSFSSISKTRIMNPEQNYLTAGRTASSQAVKGFNFTKFMGGGDGTNNITFGALTTGIQTGKGIGMLNHIGATHKDVVMEDGSIEQVPIERAKNLHLIS